MNRVMKINFKRTVVIYLLLFAAFLAAAAVFFGVKYGDRLNFAYNYLKISEKINSEETLAEFCEKTDVAADAVILRGDEVIFSVNGIYKNKLTPIAGTKKYYKDAENNIYRLADKKDFLLGLFSLDDEDDYDDRFKAGGDIGYVMNCIGNERPGDRTVIVYNTQSAADAEKYLKIFAAVLMLFFMLYWVFVSLMVYADAAKSGMNTYFWGILTLFFNLFGAATYLAYKNAGRICPGCGKYSRRGVYCTACGKKLVRECDKCHAPIEKKDIYCANCGAKIKNGTD